MSQVNSSIINSVNTAIAFMRWFALVVVTGIFLSGVTFVQPDEVALIIRFGELVGDTPAEQIHQPGLLFAFPYLIDSVIKIPIKRIQEVNLEDLYPPTRVGDITRQGYGFLLTGDENIINVRANLKYQITNPISYGLYVEEPQKVVREIARGVLTQIVAGVPVDYILLEGKEETAKNVRRLVQESVDAIDLGVQIMTLEFMVIQPPIEVKGDFDEVTSAYVEKETLLREARSYSEQKIPEAKALRDQIIREAEAYRLARISQARAEVAEFYGVLDEYVKNPEIVHQRIFYEKMDEILSKVGGQTLLPIDETGGKIILPLDVNEGYGRDEGE